MGLRDSRGEVSKQTNCFDFQLKCLTNRKNTLFYRAFGRNRLIETIDDYDGTVHRGPFQMSWPSDLDEGLRLIRVNTCLKTHRLAAVGSRSDDPDAPLEIKSWSL